MVVFMPKPDPTLPQGRGRYTPFMKDHEPDPALTAGVIDEVLKTLNYECLSRQGNGIAMDSTCLVLFDIIGHTVYIGGTYQVFERYLCHYTAHEFELADPECFDQMAVVVKDMVDYYRKKEQQKLWYRVKKYVSELLNLRHLGCPKKCPMRKEQVCPSFKR